MSEEYNLLVQFRGRLKGSITRLVAFAEGPPQDVTRDQVITRLERLQEVWKEFVHTTDQMYKYVDTSDYADPEIDYAMYEEKYMLARGRLLTLKSGLPAPEEHDENGANQDKVDKVDNVISRLAEQQATLLERFALASKSSKHVENDLPKINIPPFSGNYKDWATFRDLFVSSVDSKSTLTNVQKFHYLTSLLRDEAANLVKHLPITDVAYQTAWLRLNDRYNRPRHIVNSFIDMFMNLPATSAENSTLLRKISDGAHEVIRGLEASNQNSRDCWLIYLLLAKIDPESRRRWINDSKNKSSPFIEEFLRFLDSRCEELELGDRKSSSSLKTSEAGTKASKQQARALVTTDSNTSTTCVKCSSKEHSIAKCPAFASLSIENRRNFIKGRSLCFNCLRGGHTSYSCSSKFRCKECHRRHHTLIHPVTELSSSAQAASATPIPCTSSSTPWSTISHVARSCSTNTSEYPSAVDHAQRSSNSFILPTATVYIQTATNRYKPCRILLDCASELSYITERCAQSLALSRTHSRVVVSGISSVNAETTRGQCALRIKSRVSDHMLDVSVHVLSRITSPLPREPITTAAINQLNGLPLADPSFDKPSHIDILLGVRYVWDIFTADKIYDIHGNVIAVSSIFGWIVTSMPPNPIPHSVSLVTLADIDRSLKQFWEIEEARVSIYGEEIDYAENHFTTTHSRALDGRYVVELPFHQPNFKFSDTSSGALARFLTVERRLMRNDSLRHQYIEFMREYVSQGHMRKLRSDEIEVHDERYFYMPHHPVLGQKLRVVFDGSFKDANGVSLNSALCTGPNIQRNLFAVCFRFRFHRFVFSADIVKMFRQIWVAEDYRNYQRILWRESPSDPIEHFQLCTVTYGTSSAPFLAVRVLKQLSKDYAKQYPLASKILAEDFYVDDVLTGAETEEKLLEVKSELCQLMSRAGLELSKWVSNCLKLNSSQQDQNILKCAEEETAKVLGLRWNPVGDNLAYKVCVEDSAIISKRRLLSELSRIFDPLGLLAPVIVQYKILLQELWLHNLDWDTPLPSLSAQLWQKYRSDMESIKRVSIPRFVSTSTENAIELQGFCDASTRAYAAVVYCRTKDQNGLYNVHLVAAKTRVAPLKQVSLPRLELCGALLLSRLISVIKEILPQRVVSVNVWCDSTIVLAWLSQPPAKIKTFVANRTSEIIDTLPRRVWNHVASKENPADCASRGMLAAELLNFSLWWNGPPWLRDENLFQKAILKKTPSKNPQDSDVKMELRVNTVSLVLTAPESRHPLENLVEKSSSWSKLVKIVAYTLRFIKRLHPHHRETTVGYLKFHEFEDARRVLLQYAQDCFKEDRDNLWQRKSLNSRSKLLKLNPFIDERGLMRVGGRIRYAEIDINAVHPIILPKSHRITHLIIQEEHIKNLHAGVSALFVIIRQKYWILGARNLIRSFTFKCMKCFRQRQISTQQMMADLPAVRVRQAYPFENSGCDYAGPLTLKLAPGRKPRLSKGYICLFVCLTTSAIHLELATDLSTDCFLAALRRFMSRRGKCSQIFSDNGRNFLGASRQLDEMHKALMSQERNKIVSASLAEDGIRWNYIPPHAPHWGGIWESAVRSVKLHLRRVIGNHVLTFEQMHTLLAQIEAVVNSRPLGAAPDTDTNYLTPSHFLIGRPYTMVPEGRLSEVEPNKLDYWQLVQNMMQGFWQRWHMEYLTSLQQRPKWTKGRPNLSIGSIVVVKENNVPPARWLLAKVVETYPGKDGLVRVAKLKTSSGEIIRPVTKIVVLPTD